jgi:sarcosine oxidase subunit beta
MAVRSRTAYLEQPYYRRCGWLFLVDEEGAEPARRNREMQLREGALSDEVDAADFGVATEGVAYALYEPDSGFADPVAATRAFIEAARREGAEAREDSPVEALEPGRGVRIAGRLLEADSVVLAAGAWSKKLAATAGLDLPLEFPREQDVVFDTGGARSVEHAISSQVDRVYMRPAGEGRFLAGRGYPKDYELVDPEHYDETVDAAFEADVRARVQSRLPAPNGLRRVGGTVGLYEVTPDWHPILGPVDGYDGLFLATGGSGHCFKLGPAIGELVAGAVLGRDVGDTFSLSRFDKGRELGSAFGGNRA